MLSGNFVDGAPVWVDLGAPDVARAAEFYGSVLGWKFESAGPDDAKVLPVEVQRAHRLMRSRDRTEGMRQALLQYRAVMERMVGSQDEVRRDEVRRREMA